MESEDQRKARQLAGGQDQALAQFDADIDKFIEYYRKVEKSIDSANALAGMAEFFRREEEPAVTASLLAVAIRRLARITPG